MGLRAKADAYLNERKSAVIGELQANDFRNPFSHEEWLIGSLLRDSLGDLNRQKKLLDEYRAFMASVDAIRERPSLKDIERLVLHFISAVITASPACMYIFRNGKFIIGDAGKSEKDALAELPGDIAKSFSIWDKRYTKRYADCLPGATAEELARHEGSRITYVLVSHAVQAVIYTGKKTNGEPYDDEDLLRLSFIAAVAGLLLDAEKKTPESALRASRAEHYERLLLAGYEGDESLARALNQTASAVGVKKYILLRRNGDGKLVPFGGSAAMPQGFNLKLFGNFKSVNPKHSSPVPFTYVVKKGARAMAERTFWFIPVVVAGRLVGALLVFELKVQSDSLPEAVKAALIRIQRCLSAIYSHFPKPKRRKKAIPKKKPRRKKRAAAKNKKRKYTRRRKKKAGRPALKKKTVARRKKRVAAKKTKKAKGAKKPRAVKAKKPKTVKKRVSKKTKRKRAAGKKKVNRASPKKRTKNVRPPAAPPA